MRDRRDRPRLSLRFLAARRAAGGLPRAGGARARAGLPVIIHTREATDDTFRILREAGPARSAACFTASPATWRWRAPALDLGFYLSFAGIVTFPRAEGIRAAARSSPRTGC